MRRLILFTIVAFALLGDGPESRHRPVLGPSSPVTITPIPFDAADPSRRRAGRLRFLGGWHLEHDDPAFGSISGMALERDGLLLLSDAGGLVRLALAEGVPSGQARFDDLAGPRSGTRKRHRDSEALVLGPDSAWVTFERENAIWRYTRDLSRPVARRAPPAMRRWARASGPEAMAKLGRRFFVFAEGGRHAPPGSAPALVFDRDPTDPAARVTRFFHRPPTDYSTTDAAALPDGRLLLLHRRIGLFPYLSAKLTLLEPATIKANEIAVGTEIAALAPPLAVDNMEALAIGTERGRTIVWMASDDNFAAPFQRTLLLKFALAAR